MEDIPKSEPEALLQSQDVKVYTSYFANWRKFPVDSIAINISRYVPRGWAGSTATGLSPSSWLLTAVKNGADWDWYCREYRKEIGEKDIAEIVDNWRDYAAGAGYRSIVLCCYEKDSVKCHRSVLAEELRARGIEVEELGAALPEEE